MKCKTVHKKLIFYINDELKGSENKEINNHLKNCKNCISLFTELETTLALIEKRKPVKTNPYLYTRIKQRLEDIENEKKQSVFKSVFKKVLQPVLLSFLLAMGLFSGIKLGNTYEIKQQEQLQESQTTEFYFNDFEQENIEILLLNE